MTQKSVNKSPVRERRKRTDSTPPKASGKTKTSRPRSTSLHSPFVLPTQDATIPSSQVENNKKNDSNTKSPGKHVASSYGGLPSPIKEEKIPIKQVSSSTGAVPAQNIQKELSISSFYSDSESEKMDQATCKELNLYVQKGKKRKRNNI